MRYQGAKPLRSRDKLSPNPRDPRRSPEEMMPKVKLPELGAPAPEAKPTDIPPAGKSYSVAPKKEDCDCHCICSRRKYMCSGLCHTCR